MVIHSVLGRPFIDVIKDVLTVFEGILNETLFFDGFIEWIFNGYLIVLDGILGVSYLRMIYIIDTK